MTASTGGPTTWHRAGWNLHRRSKTTPPEIGILYPPEAGEMRNGGQEGPVFIKEHIHTHSYSHDQSHTHRHCTSDPDEGSSRDLNQIHATNTAIYANLAPRPHGDSTSTIQLMSSLTLKKLATPQPNDLWRFFSSEDRPSSSQQSSTDNNFVADLLRSDKTAALRVKEVLGVLELFESTTASWSTTPSNLLPSRDWFPEPEAALEAPKTAQNGQKRENQLEGLLGGDDANEKEIPSWRVLSAAIYFSTDSKEALLERCPPKLGRVSGDHMTLLHSPDVSSLLQIPLGRVVELLAYGEKCGVVAQQVALKPPKDLLTQKSHPHVTVSFAERVLKRDIESMKGNGSFEKWIFPLALKGMVGIKMDNGRVLFSDEEFYVETGINLKERRAQRDAGMPNEPEQTEVPPSDPLELNLLEEIATDAMPSEEIRRLAAQDSFSATRAETNLPQRELKKDIALTQTQQPKQGIEVPHRKRFPVEKTDLKVIHIGKNNLAQLDDSEARISHEHSQQELKKKQAALRVECEIHRQASWKAQRKGNEYLEMARVAYRGGDREKGDAYNRVSIQAGQESREHTDKAERLAFEASNLGRINTYTIDLHHLHLQEALARLKKVSDGLKSFVEDVKTTYRLKIITGKGINSVDKVPVLRPAVLEFLKSHGMEAEIDEHNEGVILTFIQPLTA